MTHPGWYERSRRSLLARLPDRVAPGSEAWRWAILCVRAMGEVLGVFLAVVATGLLGIGIGLALHGFDVATLSVSAPRSEALAVGVSTVMLGAVVLGVAVEGRLRGFRADEGARSWEVPVAWAPAILICIFLASRLEALASSLLTRFSDLFGLVTAYLSMVGSRGWVSGLLAMVLLWPALEFGTRRYPWIGPNRQSALYAPWMLAVILSYAA